MKSLQTSEIFQSLWIGEQLSEMEIMCIKSYLNNGHQFHLYTYGPVAGVPNGTLLRDAREIISSDDVYIDQFGGFVNLSNRFRYALLYKNGGWWVDMDTYCLKPFDFEQEYVFSSETADPYNRILVNTTFIKSKPGAQFLKDCLDFITVRGTCDLHWGELGVNLISRMIFRNNLQDFIKEPNIFCPVSGYQLDLLISDTAKASIENSYALHWWNELWRRNNLNKNESFPGSLYDTLKKECKFKGEHHE